MHYAAYSASTGAAYVDWFVSDARELPAPATPHHTSPCPAPPRPAPARTAPAAYRNRTVLVCGAFLLAVAVVTTPELAPHYVESLALMPHCYQAPRRYSHNAWLLAPPVVARCICH